MMMKHILKYYREIGGVAAMEFALVSPVLVVLLVGTLDAGVYINDKMKVESAARSSVEYVLSSGDESHLMEDIMSLYFQPQDETESEDMSWQSDVTVETGSVCECADGAEVACSASCPDPGDYRRRYIEAFVTKNHDTIFPYPGLPSSLVINGYARIQKD